LDIQEICAEVEKLEAEIVETLVDLVRIPAVGPENGGDGEQLKAQRLFQILQKVGFDKIERYDVKDSRVSSKMRPNIIAKYFGIEDDSRVWIITHMDVVPSGEESLWTVTQPFNPIVKNDRVYGRGCEDNGQSLVASIFAVKALKELGLKPKRTIALAFVSDEEQGSLFGIQYLIQKGIFRTNDLILVPDSGSEDGSFIEIAEKSILWFRICTFGKQTHASMPDKGLNAHRIGMEVALSLDELLHKKYALRNTFFGEPISTFEPTKKDKNVDAVNIVPGEDVIYFDCRILPDYDVEEVLDDIKKVIMEFEEKTGATIKLEIIQKQVAPRLVNGDSEMVSLLRKAIGNSRNIDATVGGKGGGTCAAFFRKAGIPAVVWSTIDEVAHQPDEYSKIQNLVNDTKTFALLAAL
jgi:succinyl-diaminopimelate desuccinylase